MAQLIERIGTQTVVDGKPIDLGTLVNMGAEIICAGGRIGFRSDSERASAREEALSFMRKKALGLCEEYGCAYVIVGNKISAIETDDTDWVYYQVIASFYKDRK